MATEYGVYRCIFCQSNAAGNQMSDLPTEMSYLLLVSSLLTSVIVITFYFCKRLRNAAANPHFGNGAAERPDVEDGIDEATLMSYPKVTYSQAKLEEKGATATCCSICLGDYKDTDVLRLLPQCGHLFHLVCVDPWLRSHRSCPNCRSLPAPGPVATPRAVVSSTLPTPSQ